MGGGDKGLRPLGATTVLGHVMARLTPQVRAMALNANGDPARFADLWLPVLRDSLSDHPGPLAGVLAGLDWAAGQGARTSSLSPPTRPSFRPISSRASKPSRAAGAGRLAR